jgi:hypothetical protein
LAVEVFPTEAGTQLSVHHGGLHIDFRAPETSGRSRTSLDGGYSELLTRLASRRLRAWMVAPDPGETKNGEARISLYA